MHQATGVPRKARLSGKSGKAGPEQALKPAGDRQIRRQHGQDEGEDEGRDGEIEAADAQRHGADEDAGESRDRENDRQQIEDAHLEIGGRNGGEIGADGEEAALAQGIQAEHARHQVEADRQYGEDGGHQGQALHGQVGLGNDDRSEPDRPRPMMKLRARQRRSSGPPAARRDVGIPAVALHMPLSAAQDGPARGGAACFPS